MNRDLIIVAAIGVIALLCFPLLGLIMSDARPQSIANAFATTTPLATPTPTMIPRAYLLPYRQVFAIGQSAPITPSTFMLYESGTDVFQVIARQQNFVRLQTSDGKMNFWTTGDNISVTPAEQAQFDSSNFGKTAQLAPQTGYACLHEAIPPPVFALCQPFPNFAAAKMISQITSGTVRMLLVEVGGRNYFIPPETVLSIQ